MAGFYQTSRFYTAWVINGLFAAALRMSAFGVRADMFQGVAKGPLIAEAVEELRPEAVLNFRIYYKRTFSPASD